jgi:hypothetical protein
MSRSSWTSASLLHNTLRPYSHFRTFPTAGVSISIRERTSDNVQVRTACPLSSDEDHLRRNAESLFSSTKALSCKTIYTPFLLCHIFPARTADFTPLPAYTFAFPVDAASRNSQCHLSPCQTSSLSGVRCGCHVLGEIREMPYCMHLAEMNKGSVVAGVTV